MDLNVYYGRYQYDIRGALPIRGNVNFLHMNVPRAKRRAAYHAA